MRLSIALILPTNQADYLGNTILDGLLQLVQIDPEVDFKVTASYPSPFDLMTRTLSESAFVQYAQDADLIFLVWGKHATNYALAEKLNQWQKTIFIDGSEFGKDTRYKVGILEAVASGQYRGSGSIDSIGERCRLYFRRERPYPTGIIPLPFGIESRYVAYTKDTIKDIDFVCIFGQDEYPIMRRYAREILEDFCKREGFTCETRKTSGFNFTDTTKRAGRDAFSKILARAKVGISIGGGGFDTARFWEILGNNCLLLTEQIAIYEEGSDKLAYDRIYQFENLNAFKVQLEKIGMFLKNQYTQTALDSEYQTILEEHAGVARVRIIIDHARRVGMLT